MVKWLLIFGGVLVLGYLYMQSNASAATLPIPGVPGGVAQPPQPIPGAIRGKASPGAMSTDVSPPSAPPGTVMTAAPSRSIQGGWRGSPPTMTANKPATGMLSLAATQKAWHASLVKL